MAANLIQLQAGSKTFGMKKIFDAATVAINEGEHVGVIGPNGTGKTTLFKVCSGEETLDEGVLVRSNTLRLGYLVQEITWNPDTTLEEYLSTCLTPPWDIKALGNGLGLSEEMFHMPISSLSGGYQMRCRLLHLIGDEPNLMLLDEPTNYLDLETLLVLETFLQEYRGAFMLISHDREFLRRTTDHIVEIESGEITKYPGTIDDYFEEKALLREQLEKRAMSLEAKRKSILDFAAKFGAKATKAKQAQARLKSLTRLERIEIKALPVSATIRIPHPTRIGHIAVEVRSLDLGYGDRRVLRGIDIDLLRGDHLAVVGLNGQGKSTFLKGLASMLVPMNGIVKYGYQVKIGYYAQHVSQELDPNRTVLGELQRGAHLDITPQEVRDLAGSLLFSGDAAEKKIRVLSGGEKARVALGKILLSKAPVLVLDEPINHLDFDTVEALTQALKAYPGTIVFVSHDRGFVQRVATKILEVRDGRVQLYPGTYDEYVWSLQKGAFSEAGRSTDDAAAKTDPAPATPREKINYRENRKQLERKQRSHEKKSTVAEQHMSETQKRMDTLNAELAENPPWQRTSEIVEEIGRLEKDLTEAEAQWVQVNEGKEKIDRELQSLIDTQGILAQSSQ
ncbi:MAG TPA: ABC-F family ATP-binding cassette domain-containing protein [Nitrospirales bacterium]|nr:ABC-F family ATP-binding cassette domain-containing protein [Nitrospirales bacterium]